MSTVFWQRIEAGLIFAIAMIFAVQMAPADWPLWAWPLALLAPDLSMAGYAGGPRIGAAVYNVGHLYAGGLVLIAAGLATGFLGPVFAGTLWLAHVGLDRALGYGLKSASGFRDTHLGRVGRD